MNVTQNQLLNALEEATNTKWDVTRRSIEDILQERKTNLEEKRFQEAFMNLLAVQLFEDGTGRGKNTELSKSDNQLLGVKEEDIKDLV